MFLGNLSAATERKARKATDKKKNDSATSDEGSSNPVLRRAPAPSNTSHIRYSEETGSIPRDVLMEFLQTAVKMLLDEGNQREMVLEAAAKGQGLDRIAVEFQRDILEYNFHIEKGFGCKYLSLLGERFPDDEDLLATASAFMFTCQASYVDCLRLRSRMYSKGEVPAPDPTGVMGRTAILEFFEGCTALMVLPSTKAELSALFSSTGVGVNKRVIALQRSLIQLIGYPPDHGVSFLNRARMDYGNDSQVMMKMQCFAISAQIACQEAEMTESQKRDFYDQMPLLMRPFPQMFILQQQMKSHNMQMQMAAQQSVGGGAGGPGGAAAAGGREAEIEALKSSGLLNLLSTPSGRERITQLSGRVQDSNQRMAADLQGWSADDKKLFFEGFGEQPVLVELKRQGTDPLKRINAFLDMEAEQLDAAMRLLLIVQENDGEMLKGIREKLVSQEEGEDLNWIHTVATVMGSLTSMRLPQQQQQQHAGHDHGGHDHVHDASCSHHAHGHGGGRQMMDGPTQRSATMER